MAGRLRTTKSLAQRIEREYFKRVSAIPKWRKYLTLIVAAAGIGWLTWRAVTHDQTVYSSGPMAPHHASFGKDCAACHVQRTVIGSTVTNEACLACHDGPRHQEQQTSTPNCVECHVEHKGPERLLHAGGKTCTKCHENLETANGKVVFASHIESFAKGHPEFTPLREGYSDPGGLKFNHKIHLKKDLKAPRGLVQLECNDCHRPNGISQPWPYGQPEPGEAAAKVDERVSRGRGPALAYMQSINYYKHCSSCHPLVYDKRIGERAPHKKPELVIESLERQYRTYISAHQEELQAPSTQARIPRVSPALAPRTSEDWIRVRLVQAERLLWVKTCAECHSVTGADTLPVPRVRESNLTARWLRHGNFDHSPHEMLACTGCHTQTRTSEKTSDVLLPGIKTCQTCHKAETRNATAGAECFECHKYHDWSKEKPRHGSLGLPEG